MSRYGQTASEDFLQVRPYRLVPGYTPGEQDVPAGWEILEKGIRDILCQSLAQTVTDRTQGISLLLGMYQVGLGEDRTA